MDEQQLAKWKSDIIDVGFAAKRFRALVYVVRRILWPFVRPYHWYTLDRIAEMANCASATAANAAASAAAANAAAATAASAAAAAAASAAVAAPPAPSGLSEIPNEILRLQTELARLRSEVTAAVNRQLATEAAADRIDDQFARMNDRIDGVDARLTQVADRTGQIDRRTKLVLCASHHGLVLVKEGDYVSDVVLRDGIWDEHIVALINEVAADRNGTAVDVGAHFGLLTVILAERFADVVGFEPNPVNFAMLNANIALRRTQNVTCINNALFSRETDLSLGRESQQEVAVPLTAAGDIDVVASNNLGALSWTANGTGLFRVRARPLDSYGLQDVAFLKIDAQGADGEVLLGARQTIERCRPVIVFEWEEYLSRNFSVNLADVRAFLADAGYSLEPLRVHNEKQVDYVARPVPA